MENLFSLEQEVESISNEMKQLLAAGKPFDTTFYFYSDVRRLFSITLSGKPETFFSEISVVTILASSIAKPNFIFAFTGLLPYMGQKEYDSLIIGHYNDNKTNFTTIPYRIENNSFIDLSDDNQRNTAVVPVSVEFQFLLGAVDKSEPFDQELILNYLFDYIDTLGVDLSFYNNVTPNNIINVFNQDFQAKTHVQNIEFIDKIRAK